MGKASRKKRERKEAEVDHHRQVMNRKAEMERRVANRLCLHCGKPRDWPQTVPDSLHCRKCTAWGRRRPKIFPTHDDIMRSARALLAHLEEEFCEEDMHTPEDEKPPGASAHAA